MKKTTVEKEALARVRQVYENLTQRPIERDCQLRTECCHFRLTGRIPMLTRGEAMLLAVAWRASGRKNPPVEPADGRCPLLDLSGRCQTYEARPFGCRTHFCKAAGGTYARRDVLDLIRQLEQIDVELGGDGPKALSKALREALEVL